MTDRLARMTLRCIGAAARAKDRIARRCCGRIASVEPESSRALKSLFSSPPIERPSLLVHHCQNANISFRQRVDQAVLETAKRLTAYPATEDRCGLGELQELIQPFVDLGEESRAETGTLRFIVSDGFEKLLPRLRGEGVGRSHESKARASRITSAPGIAREGSASSALSRRFASSNQRASISFSERVSKLSRIRLASRARSLGSSSRTLPSRSATVIHCPPR